MSYPVGGGLGRRDPGLLFVRRVSSAARIWEPLSGTCSVFASGLVAGCPGCRGGLVPPCAMPPKKRGRAKAPAKAKQQAKKPPAKQAAKKPAKKPAKTPSAAQMAVRARFKQRAAMWKRMSATEKGRYNRTAENMKKDGKRRTGYNVFMAEMGKKK